MSTTTVPAIPTETIKAVALVGNVVTYANEQWVVYSVEGYDYYAFQSSTDTVTCDFNHPGADWYRDAVALLLPMGRKIGEGYGKEAPIRHLSKGVRLAKG